MYNTSLTTMDANLFEQIKNLAAKLNKDQSELLEEAAQDLIKKYEPKASSLRPKSYPKTKPNDPSEIEMLGENPLFLPFL